MLAAIALSRATQADLERFLPSDDGVVVSIRRLQPTKRSLLGWFLGWMTIFWVILASALTGLLGIGFAEFHREWVLGGPGNFAFWYVAGPVYSLTVAVVMAVMVTQARALSHAVRRIDVNVLQLDRYPQLAMELLTEKWLDVRRVRKRLVRNSERLYYVIDARSPGERPPIDALLRSRFLCAERIVIHKRFRDRTLEGSQLVICEAKP